MSTIRSSSTPPNIIAPSRPFPIGEDSVKFLAGASNQTIVSEGVDWYSCACSGMGADVENNTQNNTNAILAPNLFDKEAKELEE